MRSKMMILALGMTTGMLVTTMCSPVNKWMKDMVYKVDQSMIKAKQGTKSLLKETQKKIEKKSKESLKMMHEKVDEILTDFEEFDTSSLKAKAKEAFLGMKDKVNSLKSM